MFLSYEYRLYPLRSQLCTINRFLDELTYLWNHALAERRDAWEKRGERVTYLDQQARLKAWRAHDSLGLGEVPYDVSRDALQRLDLGFRAFFRRVKAKEKRPGYPRFRRETTSFSFVPVADPWIAGSKRMWRLKIPRVGGVPVRRHRVPPVGALKGATVFRDGTEWYVSLQYEILNPDPPEIGPSRSPVGVDLGLTHLAVLSTGEAVEAPRFFRLGERKLAREQRRLSRKNRGSHRYRKQRARVARCHTRICRQRKWMAHQLSHDWTARFDLIAFEDLSIPSMMGESRLSKSISDAGWGMLRQMCKYKEALRSGRYVEVPAEGTTQTCSRCGGMADPPLRLPDRTYRCPCGYEADRDVNAARNILERGFHEVRRNTAELKRVDGTPPSARRGRRAYQRKRAPTNNLAGSNQVWRPAAGQPGPGPLDVTLNRMASRGRTRTMTPGSLYKEQSGKRRLRFASCSRRRPRGLNEHRYLCRLGP